MNEYTNICPYKKVPSKIIGYAIITNINAHKLQQEELFKAWYAAKNGKMAANNT